MASENARKAATKVLEKLGNGEKVVMGEILRQSGYSDNTADNPISVTSTKSYQDTITPFVDKMIAERDRVILAMQVKDLDTVQYAQLNSAIDTFTKNIQLLSGQETERAGVNINVVNYGDSTPQVPT